ncbi:5-bromo-4-chloroindolyl phosphate hydrolysis family protein [Pontivivens insulae]|uniref:5-bromo-4-chloroindolyl phosphate hydrolysis protein n=1 Tax=Pontivivens insulae TaxID=1639689 RepID=A0A2R8AEC0_9RHOB|nr:5-bromo-4-chloroindolyl phosphate hydrolysis family protein [Pontivivens insulae]RED11844.1 5-bromo-4-chloroindolyl phosphate hydrolysis protein [Pontivivens insulae]SPF30601.1 hypothetical protein POI8812_02941 [Pontivivens insulae]
MAKRFGGKFSPDTPAGDTRGRVEVDLNLNIGKKRSNLEGRAVSQGRARLWFLSAASIPLLIAGILQIGSGDALAILGELGAFGMLMFGIWMTREGIKAEAAYDARTVARPPRIPRKIIGGLGIGVGVGLAAAFSWPLGMVQGALYGALAVAAHLISFGLDPMKAKGLDEHSEFERDRVAGAVDRAEDTLAEIISEAERTGDRQVQARVEGFAATARAMFRKVEADPRDLGRARKFLGVYLRGTRDATTKFADLWGRARDEQAKQKYLALLDDLEQQFQAQDEALLLNDRSALDIEIEVLSDRLKQEGVRPRNME